jgi:predicted unusual protein kinase regulating ubiquinone biosynthesis (AarF/ABC1/UbiB family)
LHPGNLFVNFDEFGAPSIIVLDVGLVSKLKNQERDNLINLFTSISLGLGYEVIYYSQLGR